MKLSLAKKFGLLAATALMMACSDSSSSSDADAVETDAFLAKLEGSYTELFPAMLDEKYNALWDSLGKKYAGDNAEMLVSTLKTSYILKIRASLRILHLPPIIRAKLSTLNFATAAL